MLKNLLPKLKYAQVSTVREKKQFLYTGKLFFKIYNLFIRKNVWQMSAQDMRLALASFIMS